MTARVLVVDDVDANVKLLEARLTADYFEVRTARSGREALEICANERADVVLLDVMMPGMDGFEVCRRLKAETRTRHIPVIMVTALDQPADRVRGFEAGADDFLTKPVDDVALVKRVRNLARLKMLTDEMLMRASTEEQLGFAGDLHKPFDQVARGGRILLVEDNEQLLPAHSGRAQGRVRARTGGRSCKCAAAAPRRRFRSHHRKPQPAGCGRLAAMLASSLARPGTPFAAPDHRRAWRRCASAQGSGHGGQRLRGAPDRPERAAGEGAHPAQAQALSRPFAGTARGERRDGHSRPAHRATQSPLYGEPSRHAVR